MAVTQLVCICVVCIAIQHVCGKRIRTNFPDPETWLAKVNDDLHKYNKMSATIAWNLSVNPNQEEQYNGTQLGSERARWRNEKCSQAETLHLKTWTAYQRRQVYLLCRGPKFTPRQASKLSKLLDKLQELYTSTQVCLPAVNITAKNIGSIWKRTVIKYGNYKFKWSPISNNIEDLPWMNHIDDADAHHSTGFIYPYSNPGIDDQQLVPTSGENDRDMICMNGEPDLERLMGGKFPAPFDHNALGSKDQAEVLLWAWEAWRAAIGPPAKTFYPALVTVQNTGARNNGYHDIGETWREELETPNLEHESLLLLRDIRPLYELLHAVVRFALSKKYGIHPNGLIPAHLLGNMWAQNWETLLDIILPGQINLDESLKQTNWTALDMVKHAEDFYVSMGLEPMTDNFWKYSVFQKKSDRLKCHGTAANMFSTDDFRMIVCADHSMEDFYVIHHEMGHIQYYMAYTNLPTLYQDGATSAFQESIGDAVMMGVMTPQHLNRLGLVNDSYLFLSPTHDPNVQPYEPYQYNNEKEDRLAQTDINFDLILLLRQALVKIPQIPFSFLLDKFRWEVFKGNVEAEHYNEYFWELSRQFQGIQSPTVRGEEYFDASAKFHVPDNTPYIRYFQSSFIQAQIFRGLCATSLFGLNREVKAELPMPLHRCDIYGSKTAGKLLKVWVRLTQHAHQNLIRKQRWEDRDKPKLTNLQPPVDIDNKASTTLRMMSYGSVKHWGEVLHLVSGDRRISSDALLEYFRPVREWLEQIVEEKNIPVGW